jgi:hypothetical protein
MEWLQDLNYPALLVGSVLAFLIGWLWYSPVMFGKMWQAYYKITPEDARKNMGKSMVLGFILTVLIGITMGVLLDGGVASIVLSSYNEPASKDMAFSLKIALLCGFGFIFAWTLMASAYNNKPLGLAIVEGLYGVVTCLVFALVFAGWHRVF